MQEQRGHIIELAVVPLENSRFVITPQLFFPESDCKTKLQVVLMVHFFKAISGLSDDDAVIACIKNQDAFSSPRRC